MITQKKKKLKLIKAKKIFNNIRKCHSIQVWKKNYSKKQLSLTKRLLVQRIELNKVARLLDIIIIIWIIIIYIFYFAWLERIKFIEILQ